MDFLTRAREKGFVVLFMLFKNAPIRSPQRRRQRQRAGEGRRL